MSDLTDSYGANLKTQAQLDALTGGTIQDFRVGLVYSVPQKVGNTAPDATYPSGDPRFVLRKHTVGEFTINQDLLEYQNAMRAGVCYIVASDNTTSTTTHGTTTSTTTHANTTSTTTHVNTTSTTTGP